MAQPRHLHNAPITEAIIDLRVKPPKDFDVESFRPLKETLRDSFPQVEERRLFQGGFEFQLGQTSQFSRDMGLYGFVFKTEDSLNVAQFRTDGFTFSRLKPYTSWESVLPQARDLWNIYVEVSSPEFVTRIAVRYINHMKIPLPFRDFDEYLEAPPTLPPALPQNVSSFLSRQVIHDLESGISANFTQTLESCLEDSKHVIMMLDIDVYKTEDFDLNDQRLFPEFENLRNMKNLIFFNSITEKTARLFE